MNKRTEATAHQHWRWRNGGLAVVEHRGREHMAAIGGHGRGLALYGASPQARSMRASDLSRSRAMSDAEWMALLRRREQQFTLPMGSLSAVRRPRKERRR